MNTKQRNIAVIGIGGSGSNMLNAIIEQYPTIDTMIVNRDEVGIKRSEATTKVLMKGLLTSELKRVHDEVGAFIQHKDGIILLVGLGGLTGNYVTEPIATIAEALNIPVLAIVTLPFQFEGEKRMEQALKVGKNIEDMGITLVTFSNQQLMNMADSEMSLEDAFQFVNNEVLKMVSPYLEGGRTLA